MQYLCKPWDHQLKAIERALASPGGFAFFMDLGTGKTSTTINVLRHHYTRQGKILRTLILCPVVVCINWHREFKIHSKVADHVCVLTGSGKKRGELLRKALDGTSKHKIFVTNYEALSMKELYPLLVDFAPTIIVADEAHKIRNHKALRTKLAVQLADNASYKYILTGSPILNNPMDLFSQFRFLDGGATFGRNFYAFRLKYFYDKNAGMPSQRYFQNWQPRDGSFSEITRRISPLAITVKKKDCLDLPPLVRKRVFVPLAGAQAKAYREMKSLFVTYLQDKACVAQLAIVKGLRLQQILSGFMKMDDDAGTIVHFPENPRLDALRELLEDMIPPTEKVIVWSVFRDSYKQITDMFDDMKAFEYRTLVGGMTDKNRQEAIDSFQTNPKVRVLLANQQAGGVGVNLTAASYAVYYSRNFSLEADFQSEARNYRGGSQMHEKVTRIDLVTPETIDEAILDALARKESIADSVLKLRETFLSDERRV